MMGEPLFLGMDGGATRCRARLRDASGAVLAEAEGPAANIYVGFTPSVAVIREVASQILSRAGLGPEDTPRIALGLGLAGVSNQQDAARLASELTNWAQVRVANDAVTACIGAHAGADGGLVIAGTGSAGIARVGGRASIIGGRGFLLGDDGSAARVGADALRAALRARDGLQPKSPLTEAILARFDDDPVAMVRWASTAKPGDYGAFAPLALDAARIGDIVARPIIAAAVDAIAALARAAEALGATRIVLVGGLGGAIRPFMPAELARTLREPMFDATDGAIWLAGGSLPQASDGRPSP